jgi:hypothetical protein
MTTSQTTPTAEPDIQALLDAALPTFAESLFTRFTEHFEQKFSELQQVAPENKQEPGVTEPTPLEMRLAQMEKELAAAKQREQEQQQAKQKADFTNTLLKAVGSRELVTPGLAEFLTEALTAKLYGDIKQQKDGSYLLSSGLTVDEYVSKFYEGELGKFFVKPPATGGTGTPDVNGRIRVPGTNPATQAPDTQRAMTLAAAFAN